MHVLLDNYLVIQKYNWVFDICTAMFDGKKCWLIKSFWDYENCLRCNVGVAVMMQDDVKLS